MCPYCIYNKMIQTNQPVFNVKYWRNLACKVYLKPTPTKSTCTTPCSENPICNLSLVRVSTSPIYTNNAPKHTIQVFIYRDLTKIHLFVVSINLSFLSKFCRSKQSHGYTTHLLPTESWSCLLSLFWSIRSFNIINLATISQINGIFKSPSLWWCTISEMQSLRYQSLYFGNKMKFNHNGMKLWTEHQHNAISNNQMNQLKNNFCSYTHCFSNGFWHMKKLLQILMVYPTENLNLHYEKKKKKFKIGP